ncbi:hypothetical protein OSB04_003057 [Centaurea solstitialis]|uniref:Uncharacterized protein n=1 Tax=Centaurea solstitialis TaxID=347529 RepID=A0AA38U6M8_9ASTR|nr:hypothetical protein OSB04_003057 [Centaurea solstitialis]
MASPPPRLNRADIEKITAAVSTALDRLADRLADRLTTSNDRIANQITQLTDLINEHPKRDRYPDRRHHRSSHPKSHHRHHHYEPIKVPPLEPIDIPPLEPIHFTAIDIKSIVDTALLQAKQRRSTPEKIDVLTEKEKEPPEKPDEEIVPIVTKPLPAVIKPPQKVIPILIEPLREVVPIIAEPPQELISVGTESSPVMIEPSREISPIILEPPSKPLVKEGTTSIVPTITTYTEPIPRKVSLVSYPYEFDEITLVWSRSRPLYVDPFLSFIDPLIKTTNVYQEPENLRDPRENSRSSSFQVGVSDTDRFRAVSEIFNYFWKPGKGTQIKKKFKYRDIADLAARKFISLFLEFYACNSLYLSGLTLVDPFRVSYCVTAPRCKNRWSLGLRTQ